MVPKEKRDATREYYLNRTAWLYASILFMHVHTHLLDMERRCKARFHWKKTYSDGAPQGGMPWYAWPFALLPIGSRAAMFIMWHSVRGLFVQAFIYTFYVLAMGAAAITMNVVVPKFFGSVHPPWFGHIEQDPLEALMAPMPWFEGSPTQADILQFLSQLLATAVTVLLCTLIVDCGISLGGVVIERVASRNRRYLLSQLPYHGSFDELSTEHQTSLVRSILYFDVVTMRELRLRIEGNLIRQKIHREDKEDRERKARFKHAQVALLAWSLRRQSREHRGNRIGRSTTFSNRSQRLGRPVREKYSRQGST